MEATMSDGRVKHIVALNESTLRNIVKTMVCDVYVNDQLFERFRGDGLYLHPDRFNGLQQISGWRNHGSQHHWLPVSRNGLLK